MANVIDKELEKKLVAELKAKQKEDRTSKIMRNAPNIGDDAVNAIIEEGEAAINGNVNTEKVDRFMRHNIQIAGMKEINTDDPAEVRKRISDYFTLCLVNNVRPNMPALALSLGVSTSTVYHWVDGTIRKGKDVISEIQKAKQLMNANLEDNIQCGRINPVAGIFLAKNHFGYKDQQDVVVKPDVNDGIPTQTLLEDAKLLED